MTTAIDLDSAIGSGTTTTMSDKSITISIEVIAYVLLLT